MKFDGTVDDRHRRSPLVDLELSIVEGTVLVGLIDEVGDRIVELVELESLGMVEQQRSELTEAMSGTRVRVGLGQSVRLFRTDAAVEERVTDVAVPIDKGSSAADPVGPHAGTVELLLEIRLHRTVPVIAV